MIDRIPYEEWSQRLCQHFFGTDKAGLAVTFFVDSEVVAALAGVEDLDAGEKSLAAAVRSRLTPESTGDLFSRIVDESWAWKLKSPESCPAALPLLGAAVLAASKMERTGEIAAHNYYKRFRELLGLRVAAGMPPGYDGAMETLWRHLEWWLDVYNGGSRGVSTIVEHPRLRYIGYALSQALFRASDRQRLTHFFRALDLKPGQTLAPEELLAYFRAWVPRAHLSNGATEMARTETYAPQLSAILASELSRWDGSLRDERGRRLGQILLALDLYLRPKLSFVAERPSGFPMAAIFHSEEGGEPVQVSAAGEDYYGELPILVTPDRLNNGIRLQRGGLALALAPSAITPLRQNEGLGYWASVRQLVPGAEHWLLVRDDEADPVRHYLTANAMSGWAEVVGIAPKGWRFFRDVVIDASPETPVGGALARIVPSIRERPTLWGGLPLSYGQDVYLSGGEPDIWVPALPEGASLQLSIDASPVSVDFMGGRIQLRGRGLLPGHHEVQLGPSHLRFQTVETLGVIQTSGTGSRAHVLAYRNGRYEAEATATASGSNADLAPGYVRVIGLQVAGVLEDLPPEDRAPLLLPAKGQEYVLLGSEPGQVNHPTVPPEQPRWLEGVLPFSAGREVHPPFDVIWVLIRWGGGRWEVRLRSNREPLSEPDEDTKMSAVREWSRYFLDLSPKMPNKEAELWQHFSDVAKRLVE